MPLKSIKEGREKKIRNHYPWVQKEEVAQAIDVVVFIEKTQEGRRVTEIIRVTGHDRQQGYMLEPADAPELFIVNNGDHS